MYGCSMGFSMFELTDFEKIGLALGMIVICSLILLTEAFLILYELFRTI